MKYRYLGRSGLLVSRVCLGTMTFGMKDWGCDLQTARKITNRFIDGGGNLFDTADMYSAGVSEEMLGQTLRDHDRDSMVVATKGWFRMGATPNAKGLSRKHLFEALEGSLGRLGMEYVDLYQVHGPDPFTPLEETMKALDDLVRSGKTRYIGCSNFYGWQIVKANAIADRSNQARFISGQHLFNLARRDIEREILPACADQGMGILCWSPLASGFLTGKYKPDEKPAPGTRISYRMEIDIPRYFSDDGFRIVEEVKAVARKTDRSPSQVSLAWLLGDRRVTSVIIGPRTLEHLEDNIFVGDWDLPSEDQSRLRDIVPFNHGYPREWTTLTLPNISGNEEFPPDHFRDVLDFSSPA